MYCERANNRYRNSSENMDGLGKEVEIGCIEVWILDCLIDRNL